MVKKTTKAPKTKKTAKATTTQSKKTSVTSKPPKKVVAEKVATTKLAKKLTVATLYAWNKWLALLYAAQTVAIIIAGTAYSLPVTANFLTKDTFVSKAGESPVLAQATRHLFDINLLYLVAAILLVAAITHGLLATVLRKRYERELAARVNRARWASFGLVSALSIVTIGLISGIYDSSLLVALVALVILGSLSGLAIEVYSQGATRRRLAYTLCWIAAVVPWAVVGMYLLGANIWGSGNIPAYVYGIYGSMTVLLLGIALSMYFQYKKQGKWADYLYADRAFTILTFITLSALAWQVFAGVLLP